MASKPIMALVTLVATFCLMVTFVAIGLGVCVLPPTTTAIANKTVDVIDSPFSHDQLVKCSEAVRDYSFGSHDEASLYETMRQINIERLSSESSNSISTSSALSRGAIRIGSPSLSELQNASTLEQTKAALSKASDRYALDADAISHLDDVYNVAVTAGIAAIIIIVLAVAALAHLCFYERLHRIWQPLIASGAILIAVFALLSAWAVIDFYGLFTVFHSLFFSEGTWTFNFDSLLICSLPTEFWMGMAFLWLGVTVILSAISIVVGVMIRAKVRRA